MAVSAAGIPVEVGGLAAMVDGHGKNLEQGLRRNRMRDNNPEHTYQAFKLDVELTLRVRKRGHFSINN